MTSGTIDNGEILIEGGKIKPIVPEMDARFAFDPWFPSFEVIRELGITAQNITPGHLNLIGGRGVVIKTAGMDVEKMVRKSPSSVVFSLDPRSIQSYWAKDSQVEVTLWSSTAVDMIRNTLEGAKQYLEDESFCRALSGPRSFKTIQSAIRGTPSVTDRGRGTGDFSSQHGRGDPGRHEAV